MRKVINVISFVILIYSLIFFVSPKTVFAVDCVFPISGDTKIGVSCTLASAVDGVDADTGSTGTNSAKLTVGPGASVTINQDQKLAFGIIKIDKVSTGSGSIIISKTGSGGQMVKQPIWVQDADEDHYATSATPSKLIQSSQPAGYTRRGALVSTSADCNDNDATKWQNLQAYEDSDGDGYGLAATRNTITRRNTYSTSGFNTSVSLTRPTGTVAGDMLIMGIQYDSPTTTITPPTSDWTLIQSQTNGTGTTAVYYKVAGSEAGPYVFTLSIQEPFAAFIASYYNVDTTKDVIVSSKVADSSSPWTATAITTTFPDSKILAIMGIDNSRTWSNWTSGYTEVIDKTYTSYAGIGLAESTDPQAAIGSTGNVVAYPSSTGYGAAILLALRPSYSEGTAPDVCSGSSLPSGYAANGNDCMPSDNTKYSLNSGCYTDADGDGYGAILNTDVAIWKRPTDKRSAAVSSGNTTTLTFTKPPGTTKNDLLVMMLYTNTYASFLAEPSIAGCPSGWSTLVSPSSGSPAVGDHYTFLVSYGKFEVCYKVAGGSEPASYSSPTFTAAANGNSTQVGLLTAYVGVDTSNPIPVYDMEIDQDLVAHSITTTSTNNMVVNVYAAYAYTDTKYDDWVAASGTAKAGAIVASGKTGLMFSQFIQTTAGSTGTKTATGLSDGSEMQLSFALKPYRTDGTAASFCGASASCPSGYANSNTDCNDNNSSEMVSTSTGYLDVDGDTYGPTTAPQYTVCETTIPPGLSTTNTNDCYDNNALVFSGQTAYFPVQRGDNSFDYNCSGSLEGEPQYNCRTAAALSTSCTTLKRYAGYPSTSPSPACGASGTFYYGYSYSSSLNCKNDVVKQTLDTCVNTVSPTGAYYKNVSQGTVTRRCH